MRLILQLCVGLATCLLFSCPTLAERLPKHGTFRGIYYENRAGVGRFSFFTVSKDLRKDFAPYRNKYIEVEVLEAIQRTNPGPGYVKRIGKIREQAPLPLEVKIETIVPGSGGAETFDVLYSFRNTTDEVVVLDADTVSIGLSRDGHVQGNPDKTHHLSGYTRKELAYQCEPSQMWTFIQPRGPGEDTHFYVKSVQIDPGEEAPFILHSQPNIAGSREIAVSAMCATSTEKRCFVRANVPLDLPLAQQNAARDDGLRFKAAATRDGNWLDVKGKIVNETGQPRHIFVPYNSDTLGECRLCALIQLQDKAGNIIASQVKCGASSHPWVCKQIDENGLNFNFRIRQFHRFDQKSEERLELWVLTTSGLQKLTMSEELPPSEVQPEPTWGTTTGGARLRIRSEKGTFQHGEPVRLCFQTECDKANADVLRINQGNGSKNITVAIDGKPVMIVSSDISEECVYFFPFEGDIKLGTNDLTPGKHTAQLTLRGDPGTYTISSGHQYRQFDGTIVSNEVEFLVKDTNEKTESN